MKKILLLGGSSQQIVAIKTAQQLGYYTVLCDYLPDNPGRVYADKFYLVSTTDKDAVLKVAIEEMVDGVLAYASDPAAPTAAYVAEKQNLPGNPYESVEILCNKDRFREFLRENGFNAPISKGYIRAEDVYLEIGKYTFPVIVKPVDSSGSKGISVLYDLEKLKSAIDFAFSFSRSHRIIVEEYIEKAHPYLIGGDIFVQNGRVVLWGLLNCHRDSQVNPLVPVGKSYPLELDLEDVEKIKTTLQLMIDKLHINACAMNVELIVDKDGKVWPLDVGPRNGGNMIPDLLGMIFNTNVVKMSLQTAMGEYFSTNVFDGVPYYATHNLHTDRDGVFDSIVYSEEIKPFIVKQCIYKNQGDIVQYFDNAAKAIGIVFLKFSGEDEMHKILSDIHSHVKVIVIEKNKRENNESSNYKSI